MQIENWCETIGPLKKTYSKVAKLYDISVIAQNPDMQRCQALDILWEKKVSYDKTMHEHGHYVLRIIC